MDKQIKFKQCIVQVVVDDTKKKKDPSLVDGEQTNGSESIEDSSEEEYDIFNKSRKMQEAL